MVLTMLQIIDTAITLVFYSIIAVAAVLVLGAFFWIIDTINRFHHWLRGKRYKSMFAAPPRRRKRRWIWQLLRREKKRQGHMRRSPRGAERTSERRPMRGVPFISLQGSNAGNSTPVAQ
jgi:hypothetical protein